MLIGEGPSFDDVPYEDGVKTVTRLNACPMSWATPCWSMVDGRWSMVGSFGARRQRSIERSQVSRHPLNPTETKTETKTEAETEAVQELEHKPTSTSTSTTSSRTSAGGNDYLASGVGAIPSAPHTLVAHGNPTGPKASENCGARGRALLAR